MSAFAPASKLLDRRVQDASGEVVGRVSELLMDVDRGQIEYVLIALIDGEAGRGVEVTVPWSIVRTDTRKVDQWRLTVNRQALESIARVATRD